MWRTSHTSDKHWIYKSHKNNNNNVDEKPIANLTIRKCISLMKIKRFQSILAREENTIYW